MPAEEWQTLAINVGDELEFEVFRLDSDAAGVFCIRGKLNMNRLVPNLVIACVLHLFLFYSKLGNLAPFLKKT